MQEVQKVKDQEESQLAALKRSVGLILGDSGTARYGGYILEEPNAEWRDERRVSIIYKMRNTDNAVQSVLNAIKSPIIATEWNIESYDDTPKGEEIRDDVENNIFNMKTRSWKELLTEMLCFMEFGHYVFEIIYGIKDGKIYLVDIQPRIPSSIMKWQGPNKERGITQFIQTDEFEGSQAFIPEEKLLILTNDKEGDDLTGRSILRAAYAHWYYKDMLYRITGVSANRYGVGIPTLELPENYSDIDKTEAEQATANVRSSEANYMVLPPGFKFSIVTPEGNPQSGMMTELIDHHNRMIFFGTLSQFIPLGSDGVGSNALGSSHADFFVKMAENKAAYLEEQITRQVIKRYVDLAHGPQEGYPRLTHTPITTKDLTALSTILASLITSGAVKVDAKIKQWARQTFELPEMTDEEMEDAEAEDETADADKATEGAEPIEPPEPGAEDMQEHFLQEKPFKPSRALTMQEKRMDLKMLNDRFNENERTLEEELTAITQPQIDAYAEQARNKVDAGDIAGIATISYLLFGKTKDSIEKAINKAYDDGKIAASKEMGVERPTTPMNDKQIMRMDAEDWARNYQNELEQRSRELVKSAVMAGAAASSIAVALKTKMQGEAARMIANITGTVVPTYIARGRMTVFDKYLTMIKAFQRTEVLDYVTCAMCVALDKKVITPDDPMAHLEAVHTNCRGQWVPIYESDVDQPAITGLSKSITSRFDLVDGRPTINAFKQIKAPVTAQTQEDADKIRRKLGL